VHYSFDVILVDPDLPDAKGLEAVRRLLAAVPDAAIIVISDRRGDRGLAIRCVRFGAQDYIEQQHLSPFYLYKSVIYAIERKRILQQKDDLLADLGEALQKVNMLQQMLPLCKGCQKVYSSEDSRWLDMKIYIRQRAGQLQQIGLCPECKEQYETE